MKQKTLLELNPNDVLRVSKSGALFLGKNKLADQEIVNLQQEVKYFRTLRLHGIFLETVREQARTIMFEKAKDFDDMRSGKAMLHCLGVLENIINTVEKYKPPTRQKKIRGNLEVGE